MEKSLTSKNDDLNLSRFKGGVNTVLDVHELGKDFLRAAVNVDIDKTGKIKRRKGYEEVATGLCHSLWSQDNWPYALLVKDGYLVRLDSDESLTTLAAVSPYRRMSYTVLNETVYMSNGAERFTASHLGTLGEWGVGEPGGQPTLSLVAGIGGAAPGTYLVGVTFLSPSGEESGSSQAAVITVPDTGSYAIRLTNIPYPATGKTRVYVSQANGAQLFHAYDVPVGIASLDVYAAGRGKLLETAFHSRVPASNIVRAYRGRVYMAVDGVLYYTPAMRYGLYRLHETYFRFPNVLTMVQPVEDGIYVATSRQTFFLAGNDPKTMTQRVVDNFGAVPQTGMYTDRFAPSLEVAPGPCALWWSTNGVLMQGRAGGAVLPVTRNRLALPSFTVGATMLRESGGVRQVVSVLKGPGDGSAAIAQDSAVAQVIRNGVLIS